MKFYSQDGQDKFIAALFSNKRHGVFVDIGAYDGVNLSNSYYFEKELLWKGVCVEPNPVVFEQLKKTRNCVCLNCCIGAKEGVYKFMSVSGYGIMLSGLLDMFDKKHLDRIDATIRDHGGSKQILEVPVFPMSQIFNEQGISEVDYCNIDVEGGEMSVLQSIDFNATKIKVLTIENNYGTKEVRRFLQSHGYSLIAKLGADEVYELNSKRYGLMLGLQLKKIKDSLSRIKRGLKKDIEK